MSEREIPSEQSQAIEKLTSQDTVGQESSESQRPVNKAPLDWDTPDDAENPRNWSLAKRLFHSAIPGFLAFGVTLGTSIYAPGIPQIAEKFNVNLVVSTLGISLYSVGLAFGPVLGAPISENKGRKAVYIVTIPAFMLFTLGCGLAKNITTLLICRFLSAAAGSPCLAIGAGTTADLWDVRKGGGLASVLFVETMFSGTIIGPIVGGYTLKTRGDWTWLMWAMLLTIGPLYILLLFTSETSKKELLNRRAKARGIPQGPKPPLHVALKVLLVITFFRPLKMLLVEPIVAFIALYVAFAFGVLYAFFTAYPFVFENVYGFDIGSTNLPFVSIFVGNLVAVLTFLIFDKTLYQKAIAKCALGTIPAAEKRLYNCLVGSFGISIGLFWFAWTARTEVHWISPIIAGVSFGWGMTCLLFSGITYLVDTYGALYSASALAANGFLRYAFGAAFPLFTLQMYQRLGIPWATSLLGFLSVAMIPIPFALYYWGPAMRAKSTFRPS